MALIIKMCQAGTFTREMQAETTFIMRDKVIMLGEVIMLDKVIMLTRSSRWSRSSRSFRRVLQRGDGS